MSFGKSKARMLTEDQIKTTFADVAGCDEAKEEVAELVEYLRTEPFLRSWAVKFRKVLMVGPPVPVKPCWQKPLRVKRRCRSYDFRF